MTLIVGMNTPKVAIIAADRSLIDEWYFNRTSTKISLFKTSGGDLAFAYSGTTGGESFIQSTDISSLTNMN